MPAPIVIVLFCGAPSQIAHMVVDGVTVQVPTDLAFWARANERSKDQRVNLRLVGTAKLDMRISAHDLVRHQTWFLCRMPLAVSVAPDLAMGADFITSVSWNGAPFFYHGSLPHF
jgi:hypothetical protein